METKKNKSSQSKADQARNNVITIKVSAKEKEALQQLADDVDLTISEFLRLKGLSTQSSIFDLEEELYCKEEEINELKIALAFYEGNKVDTPGIALPLTHQQTFYLKDVFANYYDNYTPIEKQIVKYLIEDLFTYHYNFEKRVIIDLGLKTNNTLFPIELEAPFKNSSNPNELLNSFKEFGLFDTKVLNQRKSTKNERIIDNSWK